MHLRYYTVMQTSIEPLFRFLPRDVTVICGSRAISLNYAHTSPRGRCIAQTELPYELAADNARQRLTHFKFRVARLRYEAGRS
jgi:hypothetical protein